MEVQGAVVRFGNEREIGGQLPAHRGKQLSTDAAAAHRLGLRDMQQCGLRLGDGVSGDADRFITSKRDQ